MKQIEQSLQLYRTGFRFCMILAIAGAALAIFFFFFFDVRTILRIRSGRERVQTIRRMEEENLKTGRLREDMDFDYGDGEVTGERKQMSVRLGRMGISGRTERARTSLRTAETSLLTNNGEDFRITESIIVIHTDELIN